MNNTENKLPRMRLLKEAYKELKELDPNTAVTEHHIRQLAISGKIPVVMAGKKRLINLDKLIEYLSTPENNAAVETPSGTIRRVV